MMQRTRRYVGVRLGQALSFLKLLVWLLRQSHAKAPHLWRIVFACAVGYLVANLSAVGLIFALVGALEHKSRLSILGYDIEPNSMFFLISTPLLVVSLLAIASALQYFARSYAIRIGILTQQSCTDLVITAAATLPKGAAPQACRTLAERRLFETASVGARYAGMAVRLVGYASPALVTVPIVAIATVIAEPTLTALLLLPTLLILAAQYPANRMAVHASEIWQKERFPAAAALRACIEELNITPKSQIDSGKVEQELEKLRNDPSTRATDKAFADRLLAIELGGLHFQLGAALILGGALVYVATDVVSGTANFARLAAAIALLRVLLSNVALLGRVTTSIGRLLGPIHRLQSFVKDASSAAPAARQSPAETYILSARALRSKQLERYELAAGDKVALLVPFVYGRDAAAAVTTALATASGERVQVDLAARTLTRAERLSLRSGQVDIEPDTWKDAALRSLINSKAQAILLEETHGDLLSSAPGRLPIVFICYTRPHQRIGGYGEGLVVAVDRDELTCALRIPPGGLTSDDLSRLSASANTKVPVLSDELSELELE